MLKRSKDRKVTNAVMPSGKSARLANSFGLPSGTAFSCPGATSFCERICYAGKLESIYSGVKNVLLHNWNDILEADYLYGTDGMTRLIRDMIAEFVTESAKWNAPLVFRIHWDGDFFSRAYAIAWANVIDEFPDVEFWVYTRSFTEELSVIDILAGKDNLVLYLSADPINIDRANTVAAQFPGVLIATVADTFDEARATIIDTARKSYPCPENGNRIALISPKGSACVTCGVCVKGRGDVLFSVRKR